VGIRSFVILTFSGVDAPEGLDASGIARAPLPARLGAGLGDP